MKLVDYSPFISNGGDIDFGPDRTDAGDRSEEAVAVVSPGERSVRFAPRGPLALDPRAWGYDMGQTPVVAPRVSASDATYAVINIVGPLMHHEEKVTPEMAAFGIKCPDSYDGIKGRFREACASQVTHILLNIDCPGGLVAGCFDTVDELRRMAAAAGKTVWAYVDAQATSGGYALACAAEKIFVPRSGIVGSIGVIDTLGDQTALDRAMGLNYVVITSGSRKADGNPHVSISEDAVAAAQVIVDTLSSHFHEIVAQYRGISAETVKGFECGLFCGQQAIDAGLADQIATYDQVVAMLAASTEAPEQGTNNGDQPMNLAEHKAALKSIADDEDANENDREEARKMLSAVASEPDGDEAPEEKPEAAAKSEKPAEEHKEPDGDEGDKKEAAAKAAADLALVSRVQELEKAESKRQAAAERSKLMAARPDFAQATVDWLTKQPISILRTACLAPEKGGLPLGPGKGGQVGAARAALRASGTIPEGVPMTAPKVQPNIKDDEDNDMARRMGLGFNRNPVAMQGTTLTTGVMTREQAREYLAQKSAQQAALNGAGK